MLSQSVVEKMLTKVRGKSSRSDERNSEKLNERIQDLIHKLNLEPHPEGGYYRETWRSPHEVKSEGYPGARAAGTAILFLLGAGDKSRPHRVRSDELWLHHWGDPLRLTLTSPEGEKEVITLGLEQPQGVVPGGYVQEAEPLVGRREGYTLVSCVVVPGFDFEDFELLERKQMSNVTMSESTRCS